MIAFYENRTDEFYARDMTSGRHHVSCAAHLHYHLELIVFLQGEARAFADTKEYRLRAGDVFLTFPNQIHRYESFGQERYYILIVNPDMLPELSRCFSGNVPASALLPGAANDPEVATLAKNLCEGGRGAFSDVLRRGYLLTLFGKLLPQMTLTQGAVGDTHALKAIVTYCTQNYTKDLSLSVLEKELHISKYYISHLFSDKLKIGFNSYINSLRISYACRYLRHSDRSVTEISALVGFGTLRTFNRAFIRQTGKTPSEYRHADGTGAPPIPNGKQKPETAEKRKKDEENCELCCGS